MDPTTDFGFKKLFCEEANKDITISFLNALLELESPLLDLNFPKTEQLPETSVQRGSFFDLLCSDADGNRYLVEMQKSVLEFIKDRMVYYSTFPIAVQAPKGKKVYRYSPPPAMHIRDAAVATYGEAATIAFNDDREKIVKPGWNYKLKAVYCIAILDYAFKGSTTAVNYNSIRNDRPPHERFYKKLQFITVAVVRPTQAGI
jgi:hypothetical protein